MTVLFVGDNTTTLFLAAQRHDPSTKLINKTTISEVGVIPTGHISLSDLTEEEFKYALNQADELYYIPFDDTDNKILKQKTELWLRYQSHRKPVHHLPEINPISILELADSRKTSSPQLWVAGCSFTHGVGVEEKQRWGDVLASILDLPVSTLATPGSSISWAADQILRSDIRKEDLVVWGITGVSRFPYYDGKINHIYFTYYQDNPDFNTLINKQLLVSDHTLYKALTSIEQVINYCSSIGCKLLLTRFYLDISDHEVPILNYLTKFNFYVDLGNTSMIDYGTDNLHPGIEQHQLYAKTLHKFLTLY